jgi:mRNA interferase MazF
MKQYEIRWANLPLPMGRRPVLLLSRTAAFTYLNRIIVAEVTTNVRGIPVEVQLGRRHGLPRSSVVNLDNLAMVGKDDLGERIGALSLDDQTAVKRALGWALDWPELKVL